MYKLLEGLEVKLKPVSPKSLKHYKAMLLEQAKKQRDMENKEIKISDALTASAEALDIFLDKKQTLVWADLLFYITPDELKRFDKDFDEYNYEEFVRGFQDFLAKVSPIAERSMN